MQVSENDLTPEEKSAIIFALSVSRDARWPFWMPMESDSDHEKQVKRWLRSGMDRIIGRHPDQLAIAGNYQI